jgi:hypothetical protein
MSEADTADAGTSQELHVASTGATGRRSIWSMLFGGSPVASKSKSLTNSKGKVDDHISGIACSAATASESRASSPLFIPQLRGINGLTFPNVILNRARSDALFPHLPDSLQMQHFSLVYSLPNHGSDLSTLYNKVRARSSCANTLLLVQTIGPAGQAGQVFGAFAASTWRSCNAFYGSGQNFIFSFASKDRGNRGNVGVAKDALLSLAHTPLEESAAPQPEPQVEQGHGHGYQRDDADADADADEDVDVDVDIFRWTGANTLFQYSSDDKIALGGGGPAGGFGLVLDKDFSVCQWGPCDTYTRTNTFGNARSGAGMGMNADVDLSNKTGAPHDRGANGETGALGTGTTTSTSSSSSTQTRAAAVANVELWTFQL